MAAAVSGDTLISRFSFKLAPLLCFFLIVIPPLRSICCYYLTSREIYSSCHSRESAGFVEYINPNKIAV